jgi:hypothetical protein
MTIAAGGSGLLALSGFISCGAAAIGHDVPLQGGGAMWPRDRTVVAGASALL